MLCPIARANIRAWFQAYDNLQFLAVALLYLQIGCALIGSLGASYGGVLLANLAIALFALVAIESGSQTLGRTYAVLLICAILLDSAWFILFAVEIRRTPSPSNVGNFTAFSLQLVFWMQIAGFSVRFLSSFLWLQMYRLGAASDERTAYNPLDLEGRIGTFGFSTPSSSPRLTSRHSALSDEVVGGSIYNPAYYSSLFSVPQEARRMKMNDLQLTAGDSE